MIKNGDFVRIKETSDVVEVGWYKKEEVVKIKDVINIKGKKHDKLYLVENNDGLRLGIYIEDIKEVI